MQGERKEVCPVGSLCHTLYCFHGCEVGWCWSCVDPETDRSRWGKERTGRGLGLEVGCMVDEK